MAATINQIVKTVADIMETNTHTFNGVAYTITKGVDGFYDIVREDGVSLGCSAAMHGAFDACVQDAYPREMRRTLRARP